MNNPSRSDPLAQIIVAVVMGGALFYAFVWPSIISWWNEYGGIFLVSLMVFIGVIGIFVFGWWTHKTRQNRIKKIEYGKLAEEYGKRGWVNFTDRFGEEHWGSPKKINKMRKEDEKVRNKESLFGRIVEEIESYVPARSKLKNEYNYQLNLQGRLQKTFPNAEIEQKRKSSRPDIVIEDVAIELKGPTKKPELDTIYKKIVRYSKEFDSMIIVLFELKVSSNIYEEWLEDIEKLGKNHFEKFKVILFE